METKEFITSYKFAKISNVIYSGVFLENQIKELNITDFNIVSKNNEFLYIRSKKFKLNENDIVFCRTEDIKSLFYILKNNNLKNIKLITHQSDLLITDKYVKLKPECISRWYSINVGSSSKYLFPIPIGLSNEHFKNLNPKDFGEVKNERTSSFDNINKHITMFINFQKSTNLNERGSLYDIFRDKKWATIEDPVLKKESYLEYLKSSQFTLSPYGNGIDTHRIWEALYSGSVPVTKYHRTFEYLENIPVLFINDYKEINKKLLTEFMEQFSSDNFNLEKMYFQYWKDIIEMNKISSNKSIELDTNNLVVNSINLKNLIKNKFNSYLKIVKYYLRKVKDIF
mgnify:CR=1 FL=1